MKKLLVAALALAVAAPATIIAVHAQESAQDAIAARQALMRANGGAAGLSGAMLKGDLDYNPQVARAAIATMRGVALSLGAHFPEGSAGEGTKAAPAIWEKPDEFAALIEKLKNDTAAAVETAGKDGPADLDAFKAAVTPILSDCQSCHEQFRLSN